MSTTITVGTTLSDRPSLNFTASSELMQNHQAALPVSPTEELAAVYDSIGLPIVLSFSPDGEFYAILRRPGTPTGWEQVDLSPGLASFGAAKAFAAAQLPNGNIFVAVSVQSASDPSTQDLCIAGPLSDDPTQTDWSELDSLWVRSSNPIKGTVIDNVYIGPVDDGRNLGVPVLAVSLSGAEVGTVSEYVIQANVNTEAITWGWAPFPTPTQLAKVVDYALGSISDLGNGVYILYESAANQPMLVFKTFLNQYGRSYDRQFTVPSGAATLQVTAGVGGTTSLFVGGTGGIHWFSPTAQATEDAVSTTIAPPAAVPDIQEAGLVVREDQLQGGTTAVWGLSGENLYYFHSNADGTWSTPMLFRQGVARIAPLRNQQRVANELVYLGTDLETSQNVYYMWQDPDSTVWKQDHIPVKATDKILEFSCYTTHLSVQDTAGKPASDLTFDVSADSWLSVIINGTTHILDTDTTVTVRPDLQGNLTIINKVRDLSSPRLHLAGSFFSGTVEVDPTFKVSSGLANVQSPSDIPVLPQTLPSGVSADDVCSAVKNLMQFHPASGGQRPAQEIVYQPPTSPPPAKLNLAVPPGASTFGMTLSSGAFRYHDAAAVAADPNLAAMVGAVGQSLSDVGGDILEFLKNVEDRATHFLAKIEGDALHFVAKLGDEVATFAVTSFELVFKTISWVFDKIKVAFEDLIHWLGMLFDWDDIVLTHRVFVNLANQVFHFAQDELGSLEGKVTTFFDNLEAQIRALEPMGGSSGGTNAKSGADSLKGSVPSSGIPAFQFATASPGGNYGNYHLQHSGMLNYVSGAPGIDSGLLDFINDIAIPTLESVQQSASQLRDDIKSAFESGSLTVDQIIEKIVGDAIIGILHAIQTVVVGILKFISDLIGLLQSAVNDPIEDIPFISALYQKFVGNKMSILDGIMLLFAVPATAMYKLMANAAPFARTTYGLDTQGYQELWSTLRSNTAPRRLAADVAAPHLAATAARTASTDVSSGSDGSSSNNTTNGARDYSIIGGVVSLLTSSAYDGLSLMSAVAKADATGGPGPGKNDALKTEGDAIDRFQIALALGSIAGSVPVVPGPEQGVQWAVWSLSFADIVKSGLAMKMDESRARKIIGVYEVAEAVIDIGLYVAILAIQMRDDENDQKGTDLLAFFPNLLGSLGTGLCGAARLDPEGETGSALAIASGGMYGIAGMLDFAAIVSEYSQGLAHG